jgi:hypothetical protein
MLYHIPNFSSLIIASNIFWFVGLIIDNKLLGFVLVKLQEANHVCDLIFC